MSLESTPAAANQSVDYAEVALQTAALAHEFSLGYLESQGIVLPASTADLKVTTTTLGRAESSNRSIEISARQPGEDDAGSVPQFHIVATGYVFNYSGGRRGGNVAQSGEDHSGNSSDLGDVLTALKELSTTPPEERVIDVSFNIPPAKLAEVRARNAAESSLIQ